MANASLCDLVETAGCVVLERGVGRGQGQGRALLVATKCQPIGGMLNLGKCRRFQQERVTGLTG